jgi:hypothetical protein
VASGRTSRRKGAAWQAELARRWRTLGLYEHAASTQGEQTRSGRLGRTPPDVEGTPWWLEAKHTRRPDPVGALRQAEEEAGRAGDPRPALAVVRPHGAAVADAVVVMRLATFEALVDSNEPRAAGTAGALTDPEEVDR